MKDANAIVILAGGSYDGVPDFDGTGQMQIAIGNGQQGHNFRPD